MKNAHCSQWSSFTPEVSEALNLYPACPLTTIAALNDLVNSGECGLASLQVIACMDVGLLRER
jgi:hypothetical protein